MRHLSLPELNVDLEAVKERQTAAIRLRIGEHKEIFEPIFDSLLNTTALIAEIKRLLWIEYRHRREFADLLDAARSSLTATHAGDRIALTHLRAEVDRHREITADELDEWRGVSDLLTSDPASSVQKSTPTEGRR